MELNTNNIKWEHQAEFPFEINLFEQLYFLHCVYRDPVNIDRITQLESYIHDVACKVFNDSKNIKGNLQGIKGPHMFHLVKNVEIGDFTFDNFHAIPNLVEHVILNFKGTVFINMKT